MAHDNVFLFSVTPLDVVKIRLQAQKNPFPKGIINLNHVSLVLHLFIKYMSEDKICVFINIFQGNALSTAMGLWTTYVCVKTATPEPGTKPLVTSVAHW